MRQRARKHLLATDTPYECAVCGYAPETNSRSTSLEVNHKNKVLEDNDPANLEWLCKTCHKEADTKRFEETQKQTNRDLYGNLLDEG